MSELFETDAKKNEAKQHLESLRQNVDWQFLSEKVIKPKIDELTKKILDRNFKWESIEEEREAKSNREHWIILSELPEELLKTLAEKPAQETENDPYPKTIKDLKR